MEGEKKDTLLVEYMEIPNTFQLEMQFRPLTGKLIDWWWLNTVSSQTKGCHSCKNNNHVITTFYLGSNQSKESQPKFATQELPKSELNSGQTSNRCYVEAALVYIVSALHIPFSGVVTGEGYGPKDSRYEEVIKAAREVER